MFYYSLFILFDLFYIILHFTLYFSEFYFHLEEADVPGKQNLPHRLHSADSAADISDSMRNYIR